MSGISGRWLATWMLGAMFIVAVKVKEEEDGATMEGERKGRGRERRRRHEGEGHTPIKRKNLLKTIDTNGGQ